MTDVERQAVERMRDALPCGELDCKGQGRYTHDPLECDACTLIVCRAAQIEKTMRGMACPGCGADGIPPEHDAGCEFIRLLKAERERRSALRP